uniref:Uncharacterized protein n=1 Tax=Anas platyrhynchos platyrhynchos TaxID=8840 RepID=A0A493TK83_ANAPP
MASLLQSERVLYLVRGEKELRAPLPLLYFCRYCSELRSLECLAACSWLIATALININ